MKTEKRFDELKIDPKTMRAIKELGYSEMFPIQAEAIPKILEGSDIIGQAQTGTGKTAAFVVPMLEKIDSNLKKVQAIILVPTRELAVQVDNEVKKLGKYKGTKSLAIYGGVSITRQIDILKRGVPVVVGTPGRIIDHLQRGTLRLNDVKMLVLDEADRMLDMGFVEDMRVIIEKTPKTRQTLLFSATMPDAILGLAEEYLKNQEFIAVSKDELTIKNTEQVYCEVAYSNKITAIKKIIQAEKIDSAIIFCNTKVGVERLASALKRNKLRVETIHGNLSQARRNRVLSGFRAKKFRFLIATDVAARGLDIQGVSHVINYDVPRDPKDYVHRIGRTGRAGMPGKAITLVTNRDKEDLGAIEWYMDMRIKKKDYGIPKGRDARSRHRPNRRGRNKYAFGEF